MGQGSGDLVWRIRKAASEMRTMMISWVVSIVSGVSMEVDISRKRVMQLRTLCKSLTSRLIRRTSYAQEIREPDRQDLLSRGSIPEGQCHPKAYDSIMFLQGCTARAMGRNTGFPLGEGTLRKWPRWKATAECALHTTPPTFGKMQASCMSITTRS